jgi:site-specific DNA-methyltransferase (adenine-specific)
VIDTIICGDCLDVLPDIEDSSVNLVILDLPYNIKKAEWDKIQEYLTFVGDVFKECERVLKPNGSLYWFHNNFDSIVNVYTWLRNNSQFAFRQLIVWNKKFAGVANEGYLQGYNEPEMLRNYQRFAEYILYFTFQDETGMSQIFGNDDCFISIKRYMRQEKEKARLKTCKQINQLLDVDDSGGGMASHYFSDKVGFKQWALPTEEMYHKLQSTGCFQRDYEDLRREYEDLRREYEDLRREYEDLRYTFNNQKTHHSVWNFPVEKKIGHITPKPVELIETILEYSSNEGDLVLDPTAGSGTTAVACRKSNRHYICIEKEPEYCKIAERRIKEML